MCGVCNHVSRCIMLSNADYHVCRLSCMKIIRFAEYPDCRLFPSTGLLISTFLCSRLQTSKPILLEKGHGGSPSSLKIVLYVPSRVCASSCQRFFCLYNKFQICGMQDQSDPHFCLPSRSSCVNMSKPFSYWPVAHFDGK